MSTYAIHKAVSVEHKVRLFHDFSTNILTITDDKGNEHEITLYSDEPLTIGLPDVLHIPLQRSSEVAV